MKIFRPSAVYSLVTVSLVTLFFGGLVLTIGLFDLVNRSRRRQSGAADPICSWIKRTWARWVLGTHAIEVAVSGPGVQSLKGLKGHVFVSNHQSLLDIPALVTFLPGNASFVAKRELLYIPVFGWAGAVIGTIFIDRSKGTQNKSLLNVEESLKRGLSIVMFAEGTRSANGRVGPFKRGAFVFAINAQVPVVPVTIRGSGDVLPKKSMTIMPGCIEVVVDEPIETVGMTINDRAQLSDQVRSRIISRLG